MSLDMSYRTDTISVTIKVVSQAQFWWLSVVLCLPAWASAHFPSAFTPCQEDAPSWRNTACGFLCSQDFIFFHLMKHSACFICRHNYLFVYLFLFVCFFLSFLPETKTKGLASSWRIYSGTVGTDYHGFLQDIWNQTHEAHLLNLSKQDDCIDCHFGFTGVIWVVFMCIMVVVKNRVGISVLSVVVMSCLLPLTLKSNRWL